MAEGIEFDVAAIRARINAATPGPWYAGDVWVYTESIYPDDNRLSNVLGMEYADEDRTEAERARGLANAEFIANAITDIPAVLDALVEARAQVERVRALHRRRPVSYVDGHVDASYCDICRTTWPCATIRALDDAAPADSETR